MAEVEACRRRGLRRWPPDSDHKSHSLGYHREYSFDFRLLDRRNQKPKARRAPV